MDIKQHICKVLVIGLLALSGCARELPPVESSLSESMSVSNASSSSAALSSSEASSLSSESQEVPQKISIPAPEPLEFENIDFTAMSEEELKEVLEKVLDRAAYFCDCGLTTREYNHSSELKISRPFQDFMCNYYPCTNCPYKSVEELSQAMLTVFPAEALEGQLEYIFEPLLNHSNQIYVIGGMGGLSKARRWILEDIDFISVTPHECTVSIPSSSGMSVEYVLSSVTFYFVDSHIIVGMDYFTTAN